MTTSTTSFPYTGSTVIWTVPEYVKPGSNLNWVIGDAGTTVVPGVTYPGGLVPAHANLLYDVTVDPTGSASVTYTVVDPPNAPTANGPPASQWVDLRNGTSFTWSDNPGVDSGTQSGWVLKVTVAGKTWYWQADNQTWDDSYIINPGTQTSLVIPGSAWFRIAIDGQAITWQIATTESYYNLQSAWSPAQTFVGGFANSTSVSSMTAITSVLNQVTAAVSDSSTDLAVPTKIYGTTGSASATSLTAAMANALELTTGTMITNSIIANPIEFLFDHTIIGSSNSISRVAIFPIVMEVITGGGVNSYSIMGTVIDVMNEAMTASSTSVSSALAREQTQNLIPTAGQSQSNSSATVSPVAESDAEAGMDSDTSAAVGSPFALEIVTSNTDPGSVTSAAGAATQILFVTGSSTSTTSAANAATEVRPPFGGQPITARSSAQAQVTTTIIRTYTRAISQSATSTVGRLSSSELVTLATMASASWSEAALTSLLGVMITQTDVGVGVETQAAPSIQAALLSHFLDTYVVPDVKPWEIENERTRHDQALYRFGEYGIFVLMWTLQDFEAHLVGRCKTCYIPEEPLSDTWKQAAYYKCPDCLGTTFEGGYKAILVRPSLWTWDEPKLQQDKRGVVNVNVATVQTTADFRMQPKDYVIRGDGSRWQVQTMEGTHLETGFGTQSGIWDATQFTYTNVTREDESSPIYLLPFSEQFIQQAIPQYYSREPVEF